MSRTHQAIPPDFSPVGAPESICAAIEQMAHLAPDSPALTAAGHSLTYRELNCRANRLADQLCLQGVGPEIPVGLLCGRGLEGIVGMLAILKADGVCVPFNLTLPAGRLQTMLGLAGLRLAVSSAASKSSCCRLDGPLAVVRLDGPCPPAPNLQSRLRPENTSHIYFSSGSSGRPLAVLISHAATENLIRWQQQALPFRPGMRVLQFSPPGIDSAWQEIAGALRAGAELVLPTAEDCADASRLVCFLDENQVERAYLPAATLAHCADAALASGRILASLRDVVVSCGPALLPPQVRDFFTRLPGCALHAHHGYPETLAAFACTAGLHPAEWPNILPLGRPIKGTSAFVVDAGGAPLEDGRTGELWVGGMNVPGGYLRNPAANRLRFHPHPGAPEGSPARVFRTGDLARVNAAGQFELVGPAPTPPAVRSRSGPAPSRPATAPGGAEESPARTIPEAA